MKNYHCGSIAVLIIILGAVLVFGGGYYYKTKHSIVTNDTETVHLEDKEVSTSTNVQVKNQPKTNTTSTTTKKVVTSSTCGLPITTTNGLFTPTKCELQLISSGEECAPGKNCSANPTLLLEDENLAHARDGQHIIRLSVWSFAEHLEKGVGTLIDKNLSARNLESGSFTMQSIGVNTTQTSITFNLIFANNITIQGSGIIPVVKVSAP